MAERQQKLVQVILKDPAVESVSSFIGVDGTNTSLNSGRILMGYPSMGSWITYGLGSESENLPAYVVMPQPEGTPEGGTPCWGAGFLPAVYQGTVFRGGSAPILNLKPPDGMTPQRQRHTLDFLQKMNAMDTLDGDTEMAARIMRSL